MKVYVLIPSYEPDEALLQLCEQLEEQGVKDVVIVDDGSGADYADIFEAVAKKHKYTVVRNAVNMGKGRALKNAFNYMLNLEEDIIGCVTCDSDGQHSVADIRKCMQMLKENPMRSF